MSDLDSIFEPMPDEGAAADEEFRDLPAPLLGCLYCHAEGSISRSTGRKFLGFGSGLPTLTCGNCGAVAEFEAGPDIDTWRIRYKNINKASHYYYVMVFLGKAGWLSADQAITISRNGYVQRQRMDQAQHGDLNWLHPQPLDPPPPLMSPDELVYVMFPQVTFQQEIRAGNMLVQPEENVLDTGRFYLTDRKLHLLGKRRDWSHKLSDIVRVEHNEERWRLYVGDSEQHYQGLNLPNYMDAQLFSAVVKQLARRDT